MIFTHNEGIIVSYRLEQVTSMMILRSMSALNKGDGSMFKKHKKNKISNAMIFTHNCACRIVAGRLEQTASMMSSGSTLGTTVDGTHKGAGITKMQGQISRVQYSFEEQSWISNVYIKQRGLNHQGYESLDNINMKTDDIELSGDLELDNTASKTIFEFDEHKAEIDNRKDQRFEEV